MTGGLKTTGRLAIAAMFCAIGGMPGVGGQAEAADLGGDCCADLEERVAELEATTVRKGNKKVKVELYGRVNRVINFWDDGAEQNVYVENNSYSSTRFGMRGKAKISDNWSSGFQIEIEDEGNLSKFLNQFNDNVDNGSLNVRKSAIYLENKQLGKVWLGQQETAKDNITKDTVVIKGLDQTMHADFYMNWSFFLRQKGFNNAKAFSAPRRASRISAAATRRAARPSTARPAAKRFATTHPNGGASSPAELGARTMSGRRPCATRRNGTTGRSARATPMKVSPMSS